MRNEYVQEIKQYSPEQLCFCDESAVNENSTQRRWGWGLLGHKVEVTIDYNRVKRHSLLPLLSIKGYIALEVIQDSYNEERYLEWIEKVGLPAMNAYPLPNSVLVMDNAPVHNVESVRALCTAVGVILVMLPPYSPDFNPIENSFGLLKRHLQSEHENTLSGDLREAILAAAEAAMTPEVVESLYAGCGYSYPDLAARELAEGRWEALERLQSLL